MSSEEMLSRCYVTIKKTNESVKHKQNKCKQPVFILCEETHTKNY